VEINRGTLARKNPGIAWIWPSKERIATVFTQEKGGNWRHPESQNDWYKGRKVLRILRKATSGGPIGFNLRELEKRKCYVNRGSR